MGKSQKSVKEFAMIGFILLAVLFGFQIMTFIFGNLSATDYLDDVTQIATNESDNITGIAIVFANTTGYTLVMASQSNFSGGAVITSAWGSDNQTNCSQEPIGNLSGAGGYNITIPITNLTITTTGGVVTNASSCVYPNISISTTSLHKTEAEMVSESVTNDSLRAVGDYTDQAGTQFTTLGIAITLILLVAVFLFFWQAFMGKGKGEGGPGTFS